MPFFCFDQNNSGGRFVRTDALDDDVIIEAPDVKSATEKALTIGIYFDGCDDGQDCPCCGDRWSEPWRDEGTAAPEVYGEVVTDLSSEREPEKRSIVVHYADGTVKYGARPKSEWGALALRDEYVASGSPKVEVERQSRAEANAKMLASIPKDLRDRLSL